MCFIFSRSATVEIHFDQSACLHGAAVRPVDFHPETALVGCHVELVVVIIIVLSFDPLGIITVIRL